MCLIWEYDKCKTWRQVPPGILSAEIVLMDKKTCSRDASAVLVLCHQVILYSCESITGVSALADLITYRCRVGMNSDSDSGWVRDFCVARVMSESRNNRIGSELCLRPMEMRWKTPDFQR